MQTQTSGKTDFWQNCQQKWALLPRKEHGNKRCLIPAVTSLKDTCGSMENAHWFCSPWSLLRSSTFTKTVMKKWVWNNFSLRTLLLISQSFFSPCYKIWRHTLLPGTHSCSGIRDPLLYSTSTYTHTHGTHWPREERVCSVWAESIAAVSPAVTFCVCSSHSHHDKQRAPSLSAAASSCQRSIHAQGRSCLQQYINPLFCFNTLQWPSSSILFFVLFGREKGKHNKRLPKMALGIWRRKDKTAAGMSSYCHSPRKTWLMDILPQAARSLVVEEGGVVLPGSCASSAESSLTT